MESFVFIFVKYNVVDDCRQNDVDVICAQNDYIYDVLAHIHKA